MLRKDHCVPVNAKFVSGDYIFFDKQPELDTRHERRHPAYEHDTSDSWRQTHNKDFVN